MAYWVHAKKKFKSLWLRCKAHGSEMKLCGQRETVFINVKICSHSFILSKCLVMVMVATILANILVRN